ncbi:MAG TPA: hypothetical protein VLE44_00750 [Candidatus Saccharimonadales bacterium]|nr:hypothetical protein [Candidatus Saccharimonadales bacterium]
MKDNLPPTDPSINMTPQSPMEPVKPSNLKVLLTSLIVLEVLTLALAGYFGYQFMQLKRQLSQNQFNPTPSPSSIQPTENPIIVSPLPSSQSQTSNWKPYSNTKYGFSFSYPSVADFSQVGNSPYEQYKVVYIGKKQIASGRTQTSLFDGYIFYVSVRGEAATNSVDKISADTLANSKQNCSEQTRYSEIGVVKIGNQLGKTYTVTDCMGDFTETFVSNGKTTFEITQLYVGDKPEYDEYKNTTNQIISTFKFTQ